MTHLGRTEVHSEQVVVYPSVLVHSLCGRTYTLIWPCCGRSQNCVSINVSFLHFTNLVIASTHQLLVGLY
jgi:5-keto 4-deoxyuronate isomerase